MAKVVKKPKELIVAIKEVPNQTMLDIYPVNLKAKEHTEKVVKLPIDEYHFIINAIFNYEVAQSKLREYQNEIAPISKEGDLIKDDDKFLDKFFHKIRVLATEQNNRDINEMLKEVTKKLVDPNFPEEKENEIKYKAAEEIMKILKLKVPKKYLQRAKEMVFMEFYQVFIEKNLKAIEKVMKA
jgi:hypothetical protein